MTNADGRRARKRRRKKREDAAHVTLSHEACYVDLRRWLKEKGFRSRSLIPASFSGTGRGLMATQSVKAGDVVISLPESCLLTTSTVLKSYMGEYIKRWQLPVSPLLALCSFLIAERHFGDASEWSPYIKVLPKSYTCSVYFADDVMDLLPDSVRKLAAEQKECFQQLFSSSLPFFSSLQPLFTQPVQDLFTQDAFRWAWCSVNTRTVYMEHQQSDFLSREKDVYALAPYLDLLNHSPEVQVEAGFNKQTRCYEIRSLHACKKFQQVFICYGPHDNQRLLLEYGFVAAGNLHSVVYVDVGSLTLCLDKEDKQLKQKLLFLKDNDFLRNLTFGADGPSWRLTTALKLLSLKPEQYSSWKSVLLGAAVSQNRERWCVHKAQELCRHLRQENTLALERVYQSSFVTDYPVTPGSTRTLDTSQLTQLKDAADQAGKEQLGVVDSLRQEERVILENSTQLLQSLLLQW